MRRAFLLVAAGLVTALASGCTDGSSTVDASTTQENSYVAPGTGMADRGLFLRIANAPLDTVHRGTRLVENWNWSDDKGRYLAFREGITTDGQGGFSIEALETLTLTDPPEPLFLFQQNRREGYAFRYRDFSVREAGLFFSNYRLTSVAGTAQVAGRDCAQYTVDSVRGYAGQPQHTFELDVDLETGLVLRMVEFDHRDRAVAAVTYETFDDSPDLSGFVPHQPGNSEQLHDLSQDLAPQLGFDPLLPRTLPPGYQLVEASTVFESPDKPWLKLTYLDGVQPLLYMQEYPGETDRLIGRRKDAPPLTRGLTGGDPSRVLLYDAGVAHFAQAEIEDYSLIAMGKASEVELLDMIESALP